MWHVWIACGRIVRPPRPSCADRPSPGPVNHWWVTWDGVSLSFTGAGARPRVRVCTHVVGKLLERDCGVSLGLIIPRNLCEHRAEGVMPQHGPGKRMLKHPCPTVGHQRRVLHFSHKLNIQLDASGCRRIANACGPLLNRVHPYPELFTLLKQPLQHGPFSAVDIE